ncbi:hypothetical protein [Streptomyces griseiscabiei]|uniref:hypothetical protein n=1 Tax=Streptomyces griseiscabiei TaxID=2993540 RepID=UPI00117FAECE|nr:hypothetical protein [Streptomyces griseiscabiei]
MPITTKGNIPQSWPAGVRHTRGGDKPTTKTFAELKALRTFKETVNAQPGQGKKPPTDLLFAVYEPAVSYTPPAGWTLSGAMGGSCSCSRRAGRAPRAWPTPPAAATRPGRAPPRSAT